MLQRMETSSAVVPDGTDSSRTSALRKPPVKHAWTKDCATPFTSESTCASIDDFPDVTPGVGCRDLEDELKSLIEADEALRGTRPDSWRVRILPCDARVRLLDWVTIRRRARVRVHAAAVSPGGKADPFHPGSESQGVLG
mmetsp:Transcript_12355/g.30815  ORF Transcript_12355/g.30815 Transcript_12355/m.30815 type:complete len:140 (-) Transcript_12355:101-520(-)